MTGEISKGSVVFIGEAKNPTKKKPIHTKADTSSKLPKSNLCIYGCPMKYLLPRAETAALL